MSESSHHPLDGVDIDDVTPESVEGSAVRAALQADSAPVRQRGARVCLTLAEHDVDAVRPLVEELGQALTDENPGVVQTAAAALTEVATTDPLAVADVLDHVAALATSELGGVQLAGAELLASVGKQRPTLCEPIVGTLLDSLSQSSPSDDESVAACVDDQVTRRTIQQHEREEQEYQAVARQIFANVVVAVADAEPSAARDHVETLASLTTAEDLVVRGAALDALAAVASDTPSAVAPVADTVVACLDADEEVLVARAIQTLGHLEDEQYAEPLRDVATTATDDEIATFAAETASFLDG